MGMFTRRGSEIQGLEMRRQKKRNPFVCMNSNIELIKDVNRRRFVNIQ